MGTELDSLSALIGSETKADGPEWVYVVGPVGSGKSTILRMLAGNMARGRTVVALQLQPDNSLGYSSMGAAEFFDEADFKAHIEQLAEDVGELPLLILDGLFPDTAQRLSEWASGLSRPVQIICATLCEDVAMTLEWGAAAFTIRVDERRVRGRATGTITRASDEVPTYWELPLVVQPKLVQ